MKKSIIGVISALVFFFGFSSCDTGMHDVGSIDMTQLYLRGDMNSYGTTELIDNGDGTWHVTFTATSDSHVFAIASSDETWSTAYRMVDSSGTAVAKITAADFGKEVSLYNGTGLNNASIETVNGTAYTITISPKGTYLSIVVEAESKTVCIIANSNDSKNFPSNKNAIMEGDGKNYSYQFIASDDEDVSIYVNNEFILEKSESLQISVKKDYEYKIEYTITEKPRLSSPLSLLVDAEVISNCAHDYDFYAEESISNGSVLLKAYRSDFSFYISRKKEDSKNGWGNVKAIEFKNDVSTFKLEYISNADLKPVTIKNLELGNYKMTFTENDDLSLDIKIEPFPDSPTTIAGSVWNESELNLKWSIAGSKATATIEQELDADYKDGWNNSNPKTLSFALLATPSKWDDTAYKDVIFNFDGKATQLKQSGAGNNIITSVSDLGGEDYQTCF